MILGLADTSGGRTDVFCDQLLCAGCGDRPCCLAPVQTKRSLAPLSTEKHNGFSTNCLSAQKVLQMAPGVSQMPPEAPNRVLQVAQVALQRSPRGFLFQDSSSRIPPLGFLLKDSSFRIPSGFLLQASSSRLPPSGFLFQNSFSRIPPLGFFP